MCTATLPCCKPRGVSRGASEEGAAAPLTLATAVQARGASGWEPGESLKQLSVDGPRGSKCSQAPEPWAIHTHSGRRQAPGSTLCNLGCVHKALPCLSPAVPWGASGNRRVLIPEDGESQEL